MKSFISIEIDCCHAFPLIAFVVSRNGKRQASKSSKARATDALAD
jgi:hypothetical protein